MPVESGSRIAKTAGLGEFGAWKCPACGVEQTSPFGEGCQSCGAGKPGKHVGIPPPPPPLSSFNDPREPKVLPPPRALSAAEHAAFTKWAEERQVSVPTTMWAILEEAFMVGVACGKSTASAIVTFRAPNPDTPFTATTIFSESGQRARTILAALEHFQSTLYAEGVDESGEWCSAADLQQLINEYRERVAQETI